MDAFARGLLTAHRIMEDGVFSKFIAQRYGSYKSGIGAKMMAGKVGFRDLEQWIVKEGKPELESGRQEMLENVLNSYLFR